MASRTENSVWGFESLCLTDLQATSSTLGYSSLKRKFVCLPNAEPLPTGCRTDLLFISDRLAEDARLWHDTSILSMSAEHALTLLRNIHWISNQQRIHNRTVEAQCCIFPACLCCILCCVRSCSSRIPTKTITMDQCERLARRCGISPLTPPTFKATQLLETFSRRPDLVAHNQYITACVLGECIIVEQEMQRTKPIIADRKVTISQWCLVADQLEKLKYKKPKQKHDEKALIYPEMLSHVHFQIFLINALKMLIQEDRVTVSKIFNLIPRMLEQMPLWDPPSAIHELADLYHNIMQLRVIHFDMEECGIAQQLLFSEITNLFRFCSVRRRAERDYAKTVQLLDAYVLHPRVGTIPYGRYLGLTTKIMPLIPEELTHQRQLILEYYSIPSPLNLPIILTHVVRQLVDETPSELHSMFSSIQAKLPATVCDLTSETVLHSLALTITIHHPK